jgi:OmpA-OmpF porin, OOP family
MRKLILSTFAMFLLLSSNAQMSSKVKTSKKGQTLGLSFTFLDFSTAADLKSKGLSGVLLDKNWKDMKRMAMGLALTYTKGLTSNIDFSGSLGVSSLSYPLPNKNVSYNESFLTEGNANLNFKLLSDDYTVSPFLSTGVGFFNWKGYAGAYTPVGLGLQVNLFNEGFLVLQSGYRFPVISNTTASNLYYSLGFHGSIGK